MEHPAVHECAVVGEAVDGFTRAKAFVVPRDASAAGPLLEDELRAHCAGRLHRYEQPLTYAFIDELPKTLTGKIQRFKLRA